MPDKILFAPKVFTRRHAAALNEPEFACDGGALHRLVGGVFEIKPLSPNARRVLLYDGERLIDATPEFWDAVRRAYRRLYGDTAWIAVNDGKTRVLAHMPASAEEGDFADEMAAGDGFLAVRRGGQWIPAVWAGKPLSAPHSPINGRP